MSNNRALTDRERTAKLIQFTVHRRLTYQQQINHPRDSKGRRMPYGVVEVLPPGYHEKN